MRLPFSRYNSLQTHQFKVEFVPRVNGIDDEFFSLLGDSVKAVNLGLQRKFSQRPNGSWVAIKLMGFGHVIPAHKDFLSAYFTLLDAGLKVDVRIKLIGGSREREVILHTFEFKSVDLKLSGDMIMGGQERDVNVTTVGLYTEEIAAPNVVQLNDGSVVYSYDTSSST